MLIDLQSELTEGDYFPIALQFEQSGQIMVDVLVSQN
jgi:copper(I)-binding protein